MTEEFTVCFQVLFNVYFDRLLPGDLMISHWLSNSLLCTVTMKMSVVTIFRNYSRHNVAKVLFSSQAVLISHKTARDVLQLLTFHLASMKMVSVTRVHSNWGSFYKCVFTCLFVFDHVVFKCLETVLVTVPNRTRALIRCLSIYIQVFLYLTAICVTYCRAYCNVKKMCSDFNLIV